jgi:hypothetical protein
MKRLFIILIILITFLINSFSQNLYWEKMGETEKNKILNSKEIDPLVLKYYYGEININSDETGKINETLRLLAENKNDSLSSFYFYVFNQLCLKVDEGTSEIMGNYCIKSIAYHPKLVFGYFTRQIKNNDLKLFDRYIIFTGSELYFANEGKSYSLYNYKTFKDKLKESSRCFSKSEKETLVLFWQRIDEVIRNME